MELQGTQRGVPAGSAGTFPNSHHLPRNHSAHAHYQLPAPDPRPGIRRKTCFHVSRHQPAGAASTSRATRATFQGRGSDMPQND